MNSKLSSAIESVVNEYLQTKHNVTLKQLLDCFSRANIGSESVEVEDEDIPMPSPKKVEKKTINEVLKKASAKATSKSKCVHPIAKGDKKGQPCGVSVSEESKSGNYCKKHLTQEGKEEKKVETKKAAPVKGKKEEVILSKQELKEQIEKRTQEVEVRRNKHGNWEHYGSGIVLDKQTRKAYGRQLDDGSVLPLSEEDIEVCKCVGFKYILPDNIKSREDKEDSNEEEDDEDLDIDDEDIDDEDIDE
jgi:hypothetical protein